MQTPRDWREIDHGRRAYVVEDGAPGHRELPIARKNSVGPEEIPISDRRKTGKGKDRRKLL
jgi:hypothetical protein